MPTSKTKTKPEMKFAQRVLEWFHENGRHDLPWQSDRSPYKVWVSEIMLQQTQVNTVIPYFERFMDRFPTVEKLANSEEDQVLHLWTGLGYYARARNLHRTAQTIVEKFDGNFPTSVEELNDLPGIGQSTAGAILALAMNIRAPILDGNVKRVLTRYHAIAGYPEKSNIKQQLWAVADAATPNSNVADYTQAMMDLGATICTRANPACNSCPLQSGCLALNQDQISLYPGKKPKKTLPVKSVAMFILQNDHGEVLLEKRPPQGIWGSLYSLPESRSVDTEPEVGHLSIPKAGRALLTPIRHTFSHYHLDINPVQLRVDEKAHHIAESNRWLWYPLDHSLEVGLAAPVKKLLSNLPNSL